MRKSWYEAVTYEGRIVGTEALRLGTDGRVKGHVLSRSGTIVMDFKNAKFSNPSGGHMKLLGSREYLHRQRIELNKL